MYEEGEGLEEDEVEGYRALLAKALADLPGGGLRHGSILTVQDQSQHFHVEVIITHQVGRAVRVGGFGGRVGRWGGCALA
jgi:hypothetical protein